MQSMVLVRKGWIFKMKKLLIILMSVLSLTLLTSCNSGFFHNDVKANEGSIHLYLADSYAEYMDYETIPDYTLTFEGSLNTSTAIEDTNMLGFAGNDDFVVSDFMTSFLNSFSDEEKDVVVTNTDTGVYATKMNIMLEGKQKQVELEPSDHTIYEEIAYIELPNGLIISAEYRRFTSYQRKAENPDLSVKYPEYIETTDTLYTYYAWKYSTLINIVLHYPLMVVEHTDKSRSLWIVPLPQGVTYSIGATEHTNAKTIIKKDAYVVDGSYTYDYPYTDDSLVDNTDDTPIEVKQASVRDFYIKNFNGYESGEDVYFTYLGKTFKCSFTEDNFVLRPVLAD